MTFYEIDVVHMRGCLLARFPCPDSPPHSQLELYSQIDRVIYSEGIHKSRFEDFSYRLTGLWGIDHGLGGGQKIFGY